MAKRMPSHTVGVTLFATFEWLEYARPLTRIASSAEPSFHSVAMRNRFQSFRIFFRRGVINRLINEDSGDEYLSRLVRRQLS